MVRAQSAIGTNRERIASLVVEADGGGRGGRVD